MFYTVYKITNNINGKIYIGVHKTMDLNDDYMGSGIHLKRSKEKYGIENFTKEILEVFDNPEEMFNMESILVNEEFIQSKETYNLKQGGYGGWDHIDYDERSWIYTDQTWLENKKISGIKGGKVYSELLNESEEFKQYMSMVLSDAMKNYYKNGGASGFKGKVHSEETKKKIGEANSKHQSGEKNSQYGKMWIHNLELKENKKIPKGDKIPDGWLKGRKMKF